MQKKIYIYGAGHFGDLTAIDLRRQNLTIVGFIDKNAEAIGQKQGLPVFAPNATLFAKIKRENAKIIIAVQNKKIILEITENLQMSGLKKNRNFNISPIIANPLEEDITSLTSYDNDPKKETRNPLVRVFATSYNNANYIKYALNGILMQKTSFPFEIYIYDDGSTDSTSDIIRDYAAKYSNIIANIAPVNLYSTNRELRKKIVMQNMKNHKCKYTAKADADDYWTDPYKLQIQIEFLENNTDFSLCSGGFISNNDLDGAQYLMLEKSAGLGLEYNFKTTRYTLYDVNFTRVYRTVALPEYEIAEKYKDYWTDVNILYYVLKEGKGYYFPRIFGVYNKNQDGIYSRLNFEEKIERDYLMYKELYRETKDKYAYKVFINSISKYVANCLNSQKEILALYKYLIKQFPELSENFKGYWDLSKFAHQTIEESLRGVV